MNRGIWLATVIGVGTLVATGCNSSSAVGTKGVVKLDGNPLEGAMVTFVSENGSDAYSGKTDAKGEFTLVGTDGKSGAKPGTYKVTVIKVATSNVAMSPGDAGAMNAMKDMEKGTKSAPGAPKAPLAPGGKAAGGGAGGGVHTDLPVIYATADTTPFKGIKVPADQPIVLELKTNP